MFNAHNEDTYESPSIFLTYTFIGIYLYINCLQLLRMYGAPLLSCLSYLSKVIHLLSSHLMLYVFT